jgi:hypothetical protein
MDGRISPVGQLVSPLPAAARPRAAPHSPARHAGGAHQAAGEARASPFGGIFVPLTAALVTLAAVAFGAFGLGRWRRPAQ